MYHRIVAELLDDIVTGRIAAGEWLPKVDDIAARHACSPSAVREAIRALEERRVVDVHAGQGQEVLAADRWMVLDREVAEATLLRHADQRLLGEAVEFFTLLQTRAAMQAAGNVTAGDVDLLAQTLDQMRAATPRAFAAAEAEFHRTLTQLARNRFIAGALDQLLPVIARARRGRAAERDPSVIVHHERIVAALRHRDATAAAAAVDDYGRRLASWLRV